jgi:hypothetical protein
MSEVLDVVVRTREGAYKVATLAYEKARALRKAVSKQLRSTTKLSVKRMSEYLEKLMAFAVTDLGVRFSETRWEDWRGQ